VVIRPDRLSGRCIIAPRRSNSAHLHRPWRANKINYVAQVAEARRKAKLTKDSPTELMRQRAIGGLEQYFCNEGCLQLN
jgi:hypothetical protein